MEEFEKALRVYEFSYLLVPSIPEEALEKKVESMKEKILAQGGELIAEESPKFMTLAYEMSRTITNKKTPFANAYFGWIKFETTPEVGESLTAMFERDEEIIRFLNIKTIRESTLAPKKFTEKGSPRKKEQTSVEQVAEVPTETTEEAPSQEEVSVEETLPTVEE